MVLSGAHARDLSEILKLATRCTSGLSEMVTLAARFVGNFVVKASCERETGGFLLFARARWGRMSIFVGRGADEENVHLFKD